MSDDKKPGPNATGLRYVGQGAALPGVPARDLSSDELDSLAESAGPSLTNTKGRKSLITLLVDSGLYKEA